VKRSYPVGNRPKGRSMFPKLYFHCPLTHLSDEFFVIC
jgi:hypothetical protein